MELRLEPRPHPPTSVPIPLPRAQPIPRPSRLPACVLEPELTLLFLQLCFLKPLFENSFPCQEPQALGTVKSNLTEHARRTVYREAREAGQTRAQGKAHTGRTLTLSTPSVPTPHLITAARSPRANRTLDSAPLVREERVLRDHYVQPLHKWGN